MIDDAAKWQRVKEIVADSLERDEAIRDDFVRQACGEDDSVLQAVYALLAASVASEPALATTLTAPGDGGAARVIGRYQLLQKIGEGGMGEVWLAEQKEPVRRRVAVKLVKAGMNTREVIARFESERQALALMDHPTIAKVFDAGSTPEGAPYFVMEYVAGLPLTAYCDRHRLSTRERLDLFVRVCEGVQHAHHKAIIHRDLKPSNILVLEIDGKAMPKIIDFGVAKALTQKLTADTMFTRVGAIIGTPEYMSPEQALSSGEDIDTRTDVYSLGIVFYELLAGAPPLELRKIAFDEFLRRLREDEPPKPSTKIRTQDAATSTELARKRRSEPVALVKQLRGDLDSIALKALEKDRGRRYGSPAEFGADIGRYLRNEAVMAVPPSMAYRTRKFARRYRAALVTAAAFVLVLIAAAGISIRESIRANREASAAQAVNGFLQNDLLSQASAAVQSGPGTKPDPDLKVRTALDRAASRIGGKFQNEPEVEAAIRDTIGQTYLDLGLYSEARKQLERALELHRHVLGAKAPKTLKAINRIARIAWLEGKYGESEKLFEGVLELQRNVMGPEHLDTLDSMLNLGILYFLGGKYAQAEALLSHTLETQRRVLGPENQGTISSMNNLANVYKNQGKYEAAEALYSQNLDIMRRTRGPEHPNTLISMGNLADMYNLEGKYARAESLGGETLAIEQRVLGPEHRYTLVSMNNLADAYAYQGRYREAEALFQKTIETARRVLGPRHPLTLDFVAELAAMYQREGKYALAEGYAAEVLAAERRVLGQEHLDTMGSVANLALAYVSEERFSAAEPLAREAFEFNRRTQPDDPARFRAESVLGASLAGQKGYAEAELLLLEGYQGMVARKAKMGAPEWYYLDRVRDWIIRMYEEWGKPQKAAEWRKAGKS